MRVLALPSNYVAVAVIAIALFGCVTVEIPKVAPGRYSNHREMAYSMSQNLNWPGVPIDLQRELQKCAVDTSYSLYTPQEIALLDKWARGERQITDEEFWAIDEAVNERSGGEKGIERALRATCPDTIRKAEAFRAGKPIVESVSSNPKASTSPTAAAKQSNTPIFCWDPANKIAYSHVGSSCAGTDSRITEEQFNKERQKSAAASAAPKPVTDVAAKAPEQAVPPANAPTLRAALEAEPGLDVSKLTLLGSATAFFVSRSGHLLTNHHVVSNCPIASIATETGIFRVEVLASDEGIDLALAIARGHNKSAAAFADQLPAAGDDTYAIGYPLFTEYWDIKVTKGIISGLSGPDGDRRLIQMSAPVQPGNSGGPLVNNSGLVVGVVEGKRGGLVAENVVAEGIGFAVAPVIAAAFLKRNGVDPVVSEATKRREARDIVADVQEWTVPFLCFEKK
jgi:S1-C subfamily serine protease